jgi:hypothetical protein
MGPKLRYPTVAKHISFISLLTIACSVVLQTERRSVRGEAEGAAGDLLRIATLHARDHKERIRNFLSEHFASIRARFEEAVRAELKPMLVPTPKEDVIHVFASHGQRAHDVRARARDDDTTC